jgi:hypothetical protein
MALIEKFHVVAAERAVAVGQLIKEGMIVSLNSSGEVVKQDVTNNVPYGIAGDTKETSSSMPGIDIAHGWQNRVSDYYDETKASGKMTVYHSGGEFATDMFAANVATAAVNAPLYARDGKLETNDTQSSGIVARLIQAAGMYPSGVPGIDLNGDQALSSETSDTYIEIKLVI